jgi:hypothetical protein
MRVVRRTGMARTPGTTTISDQAIGVGEFLQLF